MVTNPPAMQETWVQFLGWEDPLYLLKRYFPVIYHMFVYASGYKIYVIFFLFIPLLLYSVSTEGFLGVNSLASFSLEN